MFGVANQLLSAIALAISTTYILKRAKKVYSLITLIPCLFMLVTTFAAAIWNILDNYWPMHNSQGYINVALTLIMMALASIIAVVSIKKWFNLILAERV
jgi:carbon starvation protein